jgi:hypothetical protein
VLCREELVVFPFVNSETNFGSQGFPPQFGGFHVKSGLRVDVVAALLG